MPLFNCDVLLKLNSFSAAQQRFEYNALLFEIRAGTKGKGKKEGVTSGSTLEIRINANTHLM